jgi:hypothetical protein
MTKDCYVRICKQLLSVDWPEPQLLRKEMRA